jgi:hypothetical protein
MLSPALVLAFTIASFYGLLFYLAFGKGWAGLALYWLAGVAGFAIGQWLGNVIGIVFLNIGSVNLVEGTLVSWVGLFAVRAWRL